MTAIPFFDKSNEHKEYLRDFEKISFLRKFIILPSVFPPVRLDIYALLEKNVPTG